MNNNFEKLSRSVKPIFLVSFLLLSFLFGSRVLADASHNVRGYIYLPSLNSYISLNCLDDNSGGRFPFNFPIVFSISSCEVSNHGVNINEAGNFSGSAWHYILGEIDFASNVETPDGGAFRSNCDPSCTAANNCSACLVRDQYGNPGEIFGYARVRNLISSGVPEELSGWIKLDGLSVDSYMAGDAAGNFHGFITSNNAPASVGELRFNCIDNESCNVDPDNLNWKTYIWSLQVGEMTAPNWSYDTACSQGALGAALKWRLISGHQKKWEIILSDTNILNTSSPYFSASGYDAGSSGVGSYNCLSTPQNCGLAWNGRYYWWLKLWYAVNENDPENMWQSTDWMQFDHSTAGNGKIVLGRNDSLDDYNFATYEHEFPQFWAETSATPTPIIIGTSTEIAAYAEYFQSSDPETPMDCGGSGSCTYDWSAVDGKSVVFDPPISNVPNTIGLFLRPTGTQISVRVTDPTGYYCRHNTNEVNANFSLPVWREVKVKKNAQ